MDKNVCPKVLLVLYMVLYSHIQYCFSSIIAILPIELVNKIRFACILLAMSVALKENFGRFKHAASLLKPPLTCQYQRRKHIWSNHYRAP